MAATAAGFTLPLGTKYRVGTFDSPVPLILQQGQHRSVFIPAKKSDTILHSCLTENLTRFSLRRVGGSRSDLDYSTAHFTEVKEP